MPSRAVVDRPSVSSVRRIEPHHGLRTMVVVAVVCLLIVPFIAVLGSMRYVSAVAETHDKTRTDAIVILGAAQFDGRPSPVFESRLRHARDLAVAGQAPRIITVGGGQPGDRFTEAEVGRNWLVANGVSSNQIVAIGEGHNTIDSLVAVGRYAAQHGIRSITVDTDPAHVARSLAIARRVGFDAYANPTRHGDGSRVTEEYLVRETGGYLAFHLIEQWDVPRVVQ